MLVHGHARMRDKAAPTHVQAKLTRTTCIQAPLLFTWKILRAMSLSPEADTWGRRVVMEGTFCRSEKPPAGAMQLPHFPGAQCSGTGFPTCQPRTCIPPAPSGTPSLRPRAATHQITQLLAGLQLALAPPVDQQLLLVLAQHQPGGRGAQRAYQVCLTRNTGTDGPIIAMHHILPPSPPP